MDAGVIGLIAFLAVVWLLMIGCYFALVLMGYEE